MSAIVIGSAEEQQSGIFGTISAGMFGLDITNLSKPTIETQLPPTNKIGRKFQAVQAQM